MLGIASWISSLSWWLLACCLSGEVFPKQCLPLPPPLNFFRCPVLAKSQLERVARVAWKCFTGIMCAYDTHFCYFCRLQHGTVGRKCQNSCQGPIWFRQSWKDTPQGDFSKRPNDLSLSWNLEANFIFFLKKQCIFLATAFDWLFIFNLIRP